MCIYVFTRPNFSSIISYYDIKISNLKPLFTKASPFFSNIMSSSQRCKHSQNHPGPSVCLLTSIKSLVRRPWQPTSSSYRRPSTSRPGTSAGQDRSNALELDWDLQSNPTRQIVERRQSHSSPKSNPGNNSNPRTTTQRSPLAHQRRGRRGQNTVDSMADYLTLAQLENVWQQQDTRRANQAAVTSNDNPRAQRSLPRAGSAADTQAALSVTPPPLPSSRDIHPALRPGPSFRRD